MEHLTPEMKKNNQHTRVLVTGGAGFIGSHIVDALIERGYRVFVLDSLVSGSRENVHPDAKFYNCDITNFKKTETLFERIHPNVIFHLAAQINVRASVEDPLLDAETNILGTLNLIRLSHKYGAERFIFSSSGGAMYGNTRVIPTAENQREDPAAPYGIAKHAAEAYLKFYRRNFGLKSAILRYANVYGPRQNAAGEAGVIAIFVTRMLASENPIINGTGEQTRDYVYVGDVVKANILALEKKVEGIYNIGTGIQTSVNTLFSYLNEQFEFRFKKEFVPAKRGEARASALNAAKAYRDLGWRPAVSLSDGIVSTITWFRAHQKKNGRI